MTKDFIVRGVCTLCNKIIGNWKVEETHLAGRLHQENLQKLASRQEGSQHTAAAAVPVPICGCGMPAGRRTSNTPANPGRDFYSCSRGKEKGCRFFKWADELAAAPAPPTTLVAPATQVAPTTLVSPATQVAPATHAAPVIQVAPAALAAAPPPPPWTGPLCKCSPPRPTCRQTSHSAKNPNRDFFSCNKGCKFFVWCDEVGIEKARDVRNDNLTLFVILKKEGRKKSEKNTFIIVTPTSDRSQLCLEFGFNAVTVNIIKQCHPAQRSWNALKKFWTMHLDALPDFVANLEADEDVASVVQGSGIPPLLRAAEEIKAKKIAEADAFDESEPAAITVVAQGMGGEERPHVATQSYEQTPSTQQQQIIPESSLVSRPLNIPCPSLSTLYAPSLTSSAPRPSKRSREDHNPHCICGRPHETTGGRHICRMKGSFVCDECGNTWNSNHAWCDNGVSEVQACRQCDRESLPIRLEMRPYGNGERNMGQGPHDRYRCGMCKRLGYPCNTSFAPRAIFDLHDRDS